MTPVPISVEPTTAGDVAAVLRSASEQKQSVLITGAGTKIDWGRLPGPIDVILGMRRLNRVLTHAQGDLTATVEAGASLHDVNRALAPHGQWLPLDPPFEQHATIGGLIATNDSGPLRHRYGTPRDLVIGIQLATTDGLLAKAGGQVVKNVAGYDLSKLVSGSFGSLAAIVSATFKLAPLPAASKTLVLPVPDAGVLGQLVRDVMASQLEPIAFELHAECARAQVARPALHLLLRFASLPAAVDAQIEQARALIASTSRVGQPFRAAVAAGVLERDDERRLWSEHAARLWNAPGAIVRASWLPADVVGALADLNSFVPTQTGEPASPTLQCGLIGRVAVGAGLIRIAGDARMQARAVDQLRQSSAFGHVVVVRASTELKQLVDVWGPMGDRQRLLASLKRALDPNGILNAGRGPL